MAVEETTTALANAEDKGQEKDDNISFPPGILIGQDWSKKPTLQLKESHINALRDLIRSFHHRDNPARREEVIRVWEAELFWRGYQHILPRATGGWQFAEQGSGYGPGEPYFQNSIYETNYYQSYGLSVISALTRDIPKVRMVPTCPSETTDITAAAAANKMIPLIVRNNDMMGLMTEVGRYLWTDGRVLLFTRYQKDAAKFGYKPDPEGLSPEEAGKEEQGAEKPPKSSREARGGIVISPYGTLETKMPMKANYLCECPYLIREREIELSIAKGTWQDKADKIAGGGRSMEADDISRLARMNVRMGVDDNFVTSDSEAYDVTVLDVWLRSTAYTEIKDKQTQAELKELAPMGMCITFAGDIFMEAKEDCIEDHWSLIRAMPGDGARRNGIGASYIPIQKIVNNDMELINDYLTNGIPIKWMDAVTFDIEHIKNQTNTPGGIRPFNAIPGVDSNQLVVMEPTIQFPPELLAHVADLGTGMTAQILTGVYPALSGGDTKENRSDAGIRTQRDNALGRIGIPWRFIKSGIACTMKQAVMCLATNSDEDKIESSGLKRGQDPIIVELQDLKGNFLCWPESDENFPESWLDQQNRVTEMVTTAANDPTGQMAEVIYAPQNFELLKSTVGVTGLYIPRAAQYEKQLGELSILKKSVAEPNPELDKVKQAEEQLKQQAQTNPADPQLPAKAQAIQQMLSQLPQEISSVPIDVQVDDHETHAETCRGWLISAEGRQMDNGTEDEKSFYMNVRLHFLEHLKAQANIDQKKADAAQQKIPQKGVSGSVSYGDLVKSGDTQGATQLLAQRGIQSSGGTEGGTEVVTNQQDK